VRETGDRSDHDASFCEFATAAQRGLYLLAFSLTGDHHTAEDLVQTALVRSYSRWHRLRTQEPHAYARRIVVNAHRDRWRRDRGREQLVYEPPETQASGVDPESLAPDRYDVAAALQNLTARERKVIALRYLADLSERETSDLLRMSEGAVRSALHRAVSKLRQDPNLNGIELEQL
jgi:RNA polymerase sigma-70 factor (sigma-E family)